MSRMMVQEPHSPGISEGIKEELAMNDEHNKRNDYSDFFKQGTEDSTKPRETAQQKTEENKIPYYYSYGPYRQGGESPKEASTSSSLVRGGEQEASPAERKEVSNYSSEPARPMKEWSYPVKKKSSFKSTVATFLAGALVVSGLMFAADRTNLFTEETALGNGSTDAVVQPSSGSTGNGGVTQAALQSSVLPGDISSMVENASPAVVKIETYVTQRTRQYRGFDFFFTPPRQEESTGELVPGGQGSGFIFDQEGYILTNQHVIDGAKEIRVQVQGFAEPFVAELLGSNPDMDLAVLKIKGSDPFATLPLGSSDELEVGNWVVAIGNPYGFDHTVTVGVLSAKEREIPIPDETTGAVTTYSHLLQTDASINPGNSGGPLLNLSGEVIGINTAVSAQAQGIGFAIPTSEIMRVLENLKNDVPIPQPFVGIGMADLTEAGLEELGLDNGVVIASVVDGSAASAADLQPYDVIVEFDGEKVSGGEQLKELIGTKKVGDRISLRIWRDGTMMTVGLTVGDKNAL